MHDGLLVVDVEVRLDVETLKRTLAPAQIAAVMNGIALVLNADKPITPIEGEKE